MEFDMKKERYPPDGLLKFGKRRHDVAAKPYVTELDPLVSDDCLDVLSPEDLFLLTTPVELDTMNTGEADPSSGLNGRLRPRKSNLLSPPAKNIRKPDTKPALDKPKRTSTSSKASPNKSDDLTYKADPPATQTLCPYCDKTFFTEQALSKHVYRLHLSTSKQDSPITCLFCTHVETDANNIIRHMADSHPNQYFACYDCYTRFPSTSELVEHKLNICQKVKLPLRNKLRQKENPKKRENTNARNDFGDDLKDFSDEHGFNGIVISCELKSSHAHDLTDIEDNITTNFILPPGKNIVNGTVIEKKAVIILDELQWNKRVPSNFSFQTNDADQILSRLGVVHRSPRTGESHGREWLKNNDDSHQKFEKCFDTSFYSKVASNVQENLSKFLDGSCNFNPDPENTIKTRKAKSIVAINTVEGFPILLACEQFSRNGYDEYMPRAIAPKHKWKWDNLENDKSLMSLESIRRDSHANNCIISLVSSLDIWTQLCMRRKFESKFNKSPLQKKTERKSIIEKELKEILESRELPAATSQVVKYTSPSVPSTSSVEFPASLGLVPATPNFDLKPAVLSGEWVRPRCYVCCACGAQTRDSKSLSSHISMRHQNAQIQHYEIVGEVLLNSDILKHLYVPPSQINNRPRPLRGIRECTKCKKSISLEDLHQHMLDCAGDTPAVRRKCRYRPFGVRKRRPRLPDNTIRKKLRKDIRTRHSRKSHIMRPRPRRRTEVGDAETIRKMLADLPAKRHRVMVRPVNPTIRPRRNLRNPRNKLVLKSRMTDETKKSQEANSTQVSTTSAGAEDLKKGIHDPNNRAPVRPFKTTINRVSSKIFRKKDSFNKNTLNKAKRKIGLQKDKSVNVPSAVEIPLTDSEKDSIQVEQLSIGNNPERINLNDGSNNIRDRSNRSNENANNRNRENPEINNDQNNFGDGFPPPAQNIPLKHSIASLTANSENYDRAVQLHQLFLFQQGCNNVNQHLPAGQKMLFENEAVVTKLDKPPLHFNHRRSLDLQAYQKLKLSKPRKPLNDCITMLRNKLPVVEPSSITPGHVSVQCGDDEPLDLNPMIVQDRNSTTEINNDDAQLSDYVHEHTPKKSDKHNVLSVTSKSKTRRSGSTRQGQSSRSNKAAEILSTNEIMRWKQLYINAQMLTAQNITENYNKRESSRRRNSLVSSDEFMFQHAMNLELLNQSNNLMNFAEYTHYPSISTQNHLPKKNNRRESQKNKATTNVQSTRSKANYNLTMPEKNAVELGSASTKQTNRNKSCTNSTYTKRTNDKRNKKSVQLGNTASSMAKVIDPYPQGAMIKDTSSNLNIENRISPVNKYTQENHSQNLHLNTPAVEYTSNNVQCNSNISPVQYIINNNVEADLSGPLDLSNKYTQGQFPVVAYDTYGTLDLSNKNMGNLVARNRNINSHNLVDFRINYRLRESFQPIPPEAVNNEIEEENATDLSVRRDEVATDLSVNRRAYNTPSTSYDKTTEGYRRFPFKYVQNLSHPIRHPDGRCVVMQEYYDPSCGDVMMVEKELTGDLPGIRNMSRLDMCAMEEPLHLNMYTNNTEPNDENVPTDLSGKSRSFLGSSVAVNNNICHYNHYDTQQAPHGMNTDQMINFHYDRPIRTSPQSNLIKSIHQPSILYLPEPTENFESVSNTAIATTSRGSQISDTVNASTNYEQSVYSHSEVPLSLVKNSGIERINYSSSCKSKSEYEMTTAAYTLASNCISVTNTEPTYTSATITTNFNSLSVNNNLEALSETTDNKTSNSKLTESVSSQSSSDLTSVNGTVGNITASKKLPVCNTYTSTTNSTTEMDERKLETANISKTESSDQDHETARKIAMLPRELVEILGTMPVDHRNQLLNVLPQYVSTSTSPVSHANTDEGVRCISGSSTNTIDQGIKEFKCETNSEEGRMNNTLSSSKNTKFSETSSISISSSVLLTPPTPQLSERYSLQSQENTDVLMCDTQKSQGSTEGRTPSTCVELNQSNEGSNTPVVTRLTNDPHNIIDLTLDDNSSENIDVNNVGSVIYTHSVTVSTKDVNAAVIPQPKVQKANSDKTASLRAVRIKTPSERHRSMLAENKMDKKQINVQDETNKDFDNISSKAVKHVEVNYIQSRPVTISQNLTKSPTEEEVTQEKIILKKDDDKAPTLSEKINIVTITSMVSKEMNSIVCPTVDCENSYAEMTVEAEHISSSKRHNIDSDTYDKIESINNAQTKENCVIEKRSSFDTPKESLLMEDDDSEDDVSLAVVKQKQRNSNSDSYHDSIYDVQSKQLSGNAKKRKSKKNNTSIIFIYDKCSLDDKIDLNKKSATGVVSKINSTNKDRICNENNLIANVAHGRSTRKGRRLNNAQTAKYSEEKDETIDANDYQNEINKENNVSSDIVKNLESSEEASKLKLIDQDPNRSSSVIPIVNSDNDDSQKPPDKSNSNIEVSTECSHSTDDISVIITDEPHSSRQKDTKCNLPQSSQSSSYIEQCLPQTHAGTESEILLSNSDVPNNSNKIIKCKSNNLKIDQPEKHNDVVSSEKSVKSKKVSVKFCSAASVEPAANVGPVTNDFEETHRIESDLEETNITPVRRSRRGKSLFVDSNSTVGVHPILRENELRTPFTKKQLIFSKLLLDEAKHNKISLDKSSILIEENLNKTSLDTIPNMVDENLHKLSPNLSPHIIQENSHKTSLNPVPDIILENLHKTSLSTIPNIIEENLHKKSLNTIPNLVEENLHKTSLNTVPYDSEEIQRKTSLNTIPHIKENLHNKSLHIIPNINEENFCKTSVETIPTEDKMTLTSIPITVKEKDLHKTFLNTIDNVIEENLKETLSMPILNEDKNTIVSSNSLKEQAQDIEKPIKLSSECSVIDNYSTEKLQTNKRKISPHLKRKSKKKKSFENQTNFSDGNLQQKINSKNKVIQSTVENQETISNDTVSEKQSINDEEFVKQDMGKVNVDSVITATNLGCSINLKHLSIEKRKSCSPPMHDYLPSSKPKKCKLNEDKESIVTASVSKADEKKNIIDVMTAQSNTTVTSRNTTCYNKPARRARSKSVVVVKSSSAEFYDPYDIDLEDMADKTEPFVRKEISAKMSFSVFKSTVVKMHKFSETAISTIKDISLTKSSELAPSTSAHEEALIHDNSKIDCHKNMKIDCNENALNSKDGSSDSDESSKSDVPLKKYAEKKEKKLAELSLTTACSKRSIDNTNDSNETLDDNTRARKKNNPLSINKKEETITSDKIDNEKDRRSEQFMESFGFFSERKPRKSNLLATKKISETFHIIANESDDIYFTTKERGSKKGSNDNRKEENISLKASSGSSTKRAPKCGRKKKSGSPNASTFCTVCKKSFRRSDNFLRHQMTLYHVSRLCEVELKVKSLIIEEEPNYLIAYRQQLEKLKFLQDKIAKRKKNSLPTSDIILPTLQEIIADVKRTIREQQLSRRKLSRDEALFLDCCEMLKQSHKNDIIPENKQVRQCNTFNCPQTCEDRMALGKGHLGNKCQFKSDEDMDSVTARNILESDEVRNLENDLISNLKEASGLKGFASLRIKSSDELSENVSKAPATATNYERSVNLESTQNSAPTNPVSHTEKKDQMYPPDLFHSIDMFEDKFDKIKRKCRSQAAAAKQNQIKVDPNLSNKTRKKSDKRKVKKCSKKCQNGVPTKGALKGFDGIKVSILTSDINMPAIVPSAGSALKNKTKINTTTSKKKREQKNSDVSSKSDSDREPKETSQKKVDVYEFLDTEDTELFEFRPSTIMERFKYNKELPSTSKAPVIEVVAPAPVNVGTESVSDGDDFVYMDDLVFSEDETENSVLSCELASAKSNSDAKKASPLKRKDAIEKNAVMGKIFKHNAVRSDKKTTKPCAKPKDNLDLLFDSLLEQDPKEQSKDDDSAKEGVLVTNTHCKLSPQRKEMKHNDLPPLVLSRKPEPSMSVTPFEELISQRNAAANKYEPSKEYTQSPQVLKFDTPFSKYRKVDMAENDDNKSKYHDTLPTRDVACTNTKHKSKQKQKQYTDKSRSTKRKKAGGKKRERVRAESPTPVLPEHAGVARQRARRKCTVGKQNVLAETWSSESEPDAMPSRPNSAESVIATSSRRKKSRKRHGSRYFVVRKTSGHKSAAPKKKARRSRAPRRRARPASAAAAAPEPEQPQQQHPQQQHGWIVGDSHKKLVTMLAHAKGRKRSHDDKRPALE